MTPRPPHGLRPSIRRAWTAFWRSPSAATIIDADLVALRRLFSLYEEREQLAVLLDANPDGGFRWSLREVDRSIGQLERAFLLLPKARGAFPPARPRPGLADLGADDPDDDDDKAPDLR